MRFICEVGDSEHIVEAETPDEAARRAAQAHVASSGAPADVYTVNVAEANEADFPLFAGTDYTVTLAGGGA